MKLLNSVPIADRRLPIAPRNRPRGGFSTPRPAAAGNRGFTLVEMMVSAGIYLGIFVGVVIAIQIFALRVYTLAASKLNVTADARKVMNQMRDDVREAQGVLVGNADNGGHFTAITGTNIAQGNALQVFNSTNQTLPYSIYFVQTNTIAGLSSNTLMWISMTTSSSNISRLACYITNSDVFAAEDWQTTWPGAICSNSFINNQVFSVKMQFFQWEYPLPVNSKYDYYQVRTRVCRRALD
jgi:hypothetical protein